MAGGPEADLLFGERFKASPPVEPARDEIGGNGEPAAIVPPVQRSLRMTKSDDEILYCPNCGTAGNYDGEWCGQCGQTSKKLEMVVSEPDKAVCDHGVLLADSDCEACQAEIIRTGEEEYASDGHAHCPNCGSLEHDACEGPPMRGRRLWNAKPTSLTDLWNDGVAKVRAQAIARRDEVGEILAERGERYGEFHGHASVTQQLKLTMKQHRKRGGPPVWRFLADDQREALEMIAHKIGRILNGDPDYVDSWDDIAGYAKLVADRRRKG